MEYHIHNRQCNIRTRRMSKFSTSSVLFIILSTLLLAFVFNADVASSLDEEQFDSHTRVPTLTRDSRGFVDLVVAIKEDVREEDYPTLVEDLKSAITGASQFMYRATRSLAYFKKVRILVPSSWNTTDVAKATWERYENSDFRISRANENFPYTEKFTGCGLPGRFIGLTPDYVTNQKVQSSALHNVYGTPNKVIVHEWGHYRWGLFDEYPRYASFYQDLDTGKIEATRCVLSIKGVVKNVKTGQPCGDDDLNSDGLYDSSKCVFFDDSDSETYSASIMYKQYLAHNEQFCDDPSNPDVPDSIKHNPMAPNEQNDKCQQRSAWEVLMAHPDFVNTSGLDPKPVESTEPEFVIVRQNPQTTTVLVLDVSGSMEGERLVLLQQAATNIIENILPLGSRLGIVGFNEYARVLHDIVEIDSDDTRDSLLYSLPKDVDGRTSIGMGVQKALEILFASEDDPAGSSLIVITDGEQNSLPHISDVLDDVANLTVDTVAVGAEADAELELLAVKTGGNSFSHTDGSSEIYLSFFKAAAAQMTQSHVTDAVIDADFTSINVFDTFTNHFHLDDALTGGLKITIAYIWSLSPSDINFTLTRPDGVSYDTFSRIYTTDSTYKQIKIDMTQDEVIAGEWTLNVTNDGNFRDDFNIVIQPRVKEGTTPILATAQWAVQTITPPNRQILYVFVQQGETPVINVEVNAIVKLNTKSSSDKSVVVHPHDDGIGADITKNDGIYSAYFTNFLGKGRHGVEIHVEATSETHLANGAVVGIGAASNPEFPTEDRLISFVPTGDFQREITGGSFECTSDKCGNSSVDVYPPGRITDLAASLVSSTEVRLIFTATGDDLAEGNASQYEIRVSSNFTQISKEFESSDLVPSHWFTIGDVSTPQTAGMREEFVLTLNNTDESALIFGVIAIDDSDNRGDRSNLVSVQKPPPPTSQPLHLSSQELTTELIAGITVAVVAMGWIIVAIIVLVIYRRQRSRPRESKEKPQWNGNGHEEHPVHV